MGNFFAGLIQGYGQTALKRQQSEQQREDAGKLAEMNALGIAIDSGRLTDEGFNAAIGRIEELSDTRSKKGAESPLRSVLTKLRGQVPKEKRYEGQTLDQTVQGGAKSPASVLGAGARGMAQERPEGAADKGRAPVGSQAGVTRPKTFMSTADINARDEQAAASKGRGLAMQNMAYANGVVNSLPPSVPDDKREEARMALLGIQPNADDPPLKEPIYQRDDATGAYNLLVVGSKTGRPLATVKNVIPPSTYLPKGEPPGTAGEEIDSLTREFMQSKLYPDELSARRAAIKQYQKEKEKKQAEGTDTSSSTVANWAEQVSNRSILMSGVPTKLKSAVLNYMKSQGMGLPPQISAATVDKLEERQASLDQTIDLVKRVQAQLPLLKKLPKASLVQLAQSSDQVPGMLTRFAGVFQSDKDKLDIAELAGNLRSLQESINIIRAPLGATGFRGEEGWSALQRQSVSALSAPEVNAATLGNTLQYLQRLRDTTSRVLSGPDQATEQSSTETPAGSSDAPPPPKVGTVVRGYRFKGGDPADRGSWERVKVANAAGR